MAKKSVEEKKVVERKASIRMYPEQYTLEDYLSTNIIGSTINSGKTKISTMNDAMYKVFTNPRKGKQGDAFVLGGRYTHTSKLSNALSNVYIFDDIDSNTEYIITNNTKTTNILFSGTLSNAPLIALQTKLTEDDNRTLLEHLLQRTKESEMFWYKYNYTNLFAKKNNLKTYQKDWDDICDEVNKAYNNKLMPKDSSLLAHQVYFRKDNTENDKKDYDLLTVMPNISMLIEVTKRLNNIDKNKQKYPMPIKRNFGDKPQNYCGAFSSYSNLIVLKAFPPNIDYNKRKLIMKDFFSQYVRSPFDKTFYIAMAKLFKYFQFPERRTMYKMIEEQIFQKIIEKRFELVNTFEEKWTSDEKINLPQHQKIWLDDAYSSIRKKNKYWVYELANDCTKWFISMYKKSKDAMNIHELSLEDATWIKNVIIRLFMKEDF